MVQHIVENQFMVSDKENEELNQGEYIIFAVNEDREVVTNEKIINSINEIKYRLDVNMKMVFK